MFNKYYQTEIAYLREMGREFGIANPAIAGMLADRGGDPDVERLLEGFAFLAARIRERTDAAVPEVIQGLTQLLLPHYLRPIPACTIVEFTPQSNALRAPLRVPRGTELAASPLEGTSCLFQTCADIMLLPATLSASSVEYSTAATPVLRVLIQASQKENAHWLPAALRFFLHGEFSVTSTLFLWLFRYCRGIELRAPDLPSSRVQLPANALRAVGFESTETLFPWPKLSSDGYRLLQEFFTLPQKFLFFELVGIEAAAAKLKDNLEIRFEFDRPPPLPAPVNPDVVRLHCVPAINLFAASAHPLRMNAPEQEHLLRASGVAPRHMEVYSVDSVSGLRSGRAERIEYQPFVDYVRTAENHAFYRLRHAASPIDDGLDTFLSLGSPRDVRPSLDEEVLSIALTCTNRSLPGELRVGDLNAATSTSPPLARFTNLVPVTKPLRPPLGTELHWRLLSHLALTQRSLGQVETLRALLGLYNFQSHGDYPTARANNLRLNSIRAIHSSPIRRFIEGSPARGQRTMLELDERGFASLGDLFIFGWILDELLTATLTINSFQELAVQVSPSRMEYLWPAKSGTQPIL